MYSTTNNILILNIVSLSFDGLFNAFKTFIFYSIHYSNIPINNTTEVQCYFVSSYVNHDFLNKYLDNNRSDDIKIPAYQNVVNKSIDIKLYYI